MPSPVDLNGAQPVAAFSLTASDDSSGVNSAAIFFDKAISTVDPDGNISLVQWAYLAPGGNGTFSITETLSQFANPGTYHVTEVQLYDNAGNLHDYLASDLAGGGFSSTFVFSGGTADNAPPTLNTLSLPQNVNLNGGNPTATFSLTASDDISGVTSAVIFFDNAISVIDGEGNVSPVSSIVLTSTGSGTFSITETLSQFAAPGTYHVTEVQLRDNAGNLHDYLAADLGALSIDNAFTFTNGTADTTAPVLTRLIVPFVNLGRPNPVATFGLTASDDLSGINSVTIFFDSAISTVDNDNNVTPILSAVLSTAGNGSFYIAEALSQFVGPGTHNITKVQLSDNAGNVRDYVSSDFVASGFDAAFVFASSIVVNGGDTVPANIIADNVLISGGTQQVFGGTTKASVVGGSQLIQSGGHASGTVLSSGGQMTVSSGGSARGTVVSSGSLEVVLPGGTVTSTTLTNGGSEYIYAGGTATGATVSNGATQNVVGSARDTTLAGFQIVYSGAVASGTDITNGGYQYILPGGTASGTTVADGGIQNVDGTAVDTTLAGFQVIFDGFTASGTHVTSTGYQYILPGGTARDNVVDFGGIQNVVGRSENTSLGGFQVVFSGGVISNTTLTSGGYQYILNGGTVSTTTLLSGSLQNNNGLAINTVLSSGTQQIVFSGAVASNTTVMAGGFEIVVSGGLATGTTISGGFVELGGGDGLGSGGVITLLSGTLQLDDARHFNGKIADFGLHDILDLRDITYGANTTFAFQEDAGNTFGTLTVSDGVHSANITLLGQYVSQQFKLAANGFGGTIVTDPPISASTSFYSLDQRLQGAGAPT